MFWLVYIVRVLVLVHGACVKSARNLCYTFVGLCTNSKVLWLVHVAGVTSRAKETDLVGDRGGRGGGTRIP